MDPRRLRRIIAEDPEWNLPTVPSLARLCMTQLTLSFAEKPVVNQLPDKYRSQLMTTLGTDLPLEVTTELIEDDVYWKRCCAARWPVKQAKGDVTWKQLFFESYLQEKMEKAVPQTETEAELTAVVALCQKHARRLTLSQLQPPASSPPPAKEPEAPVVSQELGGTEMAADPEEPEVGTIVETWDHIEMAPILSNMPNLRHFSVTYRVNNCKMDFKWKMFGLTTRDMEQLAYAVKSHGQLHSLAITNSLVDDKKARVLIKDLLGNTSLRRLDLSNNIIGDKGARAIAKFLASNGSLTELILTDNKIGAQGIMAIGSALKGNTTLKTLSMRMNRFGDAGGKAFFQGVQGNIALESLNFAGTQIGRHTIKALAECLEAGNPLANMDLTCNELGVESGRSLLAALEGNKVMRTLDLRLTKVEKDTEAAINRLLKENLRRTVTTLR